MDLEGDVTAEAELSPDEDGVDEGTTFRTESRRGRGRPSKSSRNDDDDEDEAEEDSRADLSRSVRGKKSVSSRRTTTGTTAADDDADDSHRFEPDMGNDYKKDDTNDTGDYGASNNDYPAADEEEEESVDLERRAVEAEGGDEDVDEDEDPAPRERTKVKTVRGKVGRPKVQKLPREKRAPADPMSVPARTRMSGIGTHSKSTTG